ncbi:phospholipase [Candida orthopsilosis Co 90-125]|uniref:Phospholipase n=1 Tax=Candida orthopsilosis (strain 90-125) TaxID=1136231 RepID=H8X6U1_CANO9|nr:phospholipase [Candida orthopsilosis Co 90-125]CCG23702.1 phospholipase [Candida orthopsilosis Co 90-125]
MIKYLVDNTILPPVAFIINNTPSFIWAIIEFFFDICFFWVKHLYHIYNRRDPLKEYIKQLQNASNYNEWKSTAFEIDRLTNMDLWRQNFISKHYDYVLINERINTLAEARENNDSQKIMSLLRSGLIRNFGGIAQKRLYLKSYMGTKFKIEEYINEILHCLEFLNESLSSSNGNEYVMNSKQLKLDFFHDTRQSFGSTALLLQGGSLFGLCHLGVVKALYFKRLLPRVIGGSAVGAAVASLVCTSTDDELIPILVNIEEMMKNIDILNHEIDERFGNVIENVVRKGYSQDILLFLKFVRDTIGDLTFEEAYIKTGKILNIVIHPTNRSVPSLLNYITAPNVIIWTAIYASIGTGVLSDDIALYVKDYNNEIVLQTPDLDVKFLKPQEVTYHTSYFKNNVTTDISQHHSPFTKLTELFNVNHFVISLAKPYLAPLISNDLKHYHASYGKVRYDKRTKTYDGSEMSKRDIEKFAKDSGFNLKKKLKTIIGMEILHRIIVLNKLGLLTEVMKRLFIDEKPTAMQYAASIREVTIVPEMRYLVKDLGRVFDIHRTKENIPYWILVGERSVWPLFPMLWTRCAIEFALDDLYNLHRKRS